MRPRRAAASAALALAAALAATPARAGVLRACDRGLQPSAVQQDRLLRFAALLRATLEAADTPVALVARSGTDLRRIGQRYSHAGLSLRDSPNTPWSVRQLYFACEEQRPRLFDQGLAGFVLGADDLDQGHVSLVLLPPEAAEPLARSALDTPQALALLHPRYSANAHAWSLRYQNCNQWVAELMARAWGDDSARSDSAPRAAAQHWLAAQGYQPSTVQVGALFGLSLFMPWVHNDDHPEADLARTQYRVSLPESLEAFARARWPAAQRVELCRTPTHMVLHRGWTPLAEGCEAGPGDQRIPLD